MLELTQPPKPCPSLFLRFPASLSLLSPRLFGLHCYSVPETLGALTTRIFRSALPR